TGRESLGRHQRTVVTLRPADILERFFETLFLDVDELVVSPDGPLVILDHERSERNVVFAMRVIDRAARLAVHACDLAVLVLIIGDDGLEVADQQRLTSFLQYDGAQHIENLPFVKTKIAVAAYICDRLSKMFEHNILLRLALRLRRRALCLLGRGGDG